MSNCVEPETLKKKKKEEKRELHCQYQGQRLVVCNKTNKTHFEEDRVRSIGTGVTDSDLMSSMSECSSSSAEDNI